MAADFVQSPDSRAALSLISPHVPEEVAGPGVGVGLYRGEQVKPGALPGVLIGSNRVWRDGKEMITTVETVFPAGSVAAMSGEESESLGLAARCWLGASSLTMAVVGLGAKFILRGMNTTVVHGKEHLDRIFQAGQQGPVISVINHDSCFDDPGVWGALLSPTQLANTSRMRWGASASEVIFINRPLETFWKLGKVIPIVRGWGVEQPAMKFLQERLDRGGWVNIFPEGKVTEADGVGACRWGVGRLIWNSSSSPAILPVIHIGMNKILPNPSSDQEKQSYVMRPGNLVTVNVGQPVQLEEMVRDLRERGVDAVQARRELTREVQTVMERLYEETRQLHRQNIVKWLTKWHDQLDLTPSVLT